MTRYLKKPAIFFAVLLALVLALGELLEYLALQIDPNEPKVAEVLELKNKNYNTLILGNSISQQGFNPRIIDSVAGLNSYNMAIGGASVFSMELLLRNYLVHNKKPERIIYGLYVNEKKWPFRVRPSIAEGIEDELKDEFYTNNPQLEKNPKMELYNRFKIFRYRNVIEHALKYLYDKETYNYNYYKGFIIRRAVAKPINQHPPNTAGNNIEALQRLITFAQEKNIELYFVEPPNHAAFNHATVNRKEVLQELATLPGFQNIYINLNHPEKYQLADWDSKNHLNISGANKLSTEFAHKLKSRLKQ